MGYACTTDDTLTVDPPLNPRERAYLRRLGRGTPSRGRWPGSSLPWTIGDDGATLSMDVEFGTKEPIAEWVVFLRTHLLGEEGPALVGRTFAGFTYDHRVLGEATVTGEIRTDRWTLIADEDGVVVDRFSMPCPSCWAGTLLTVRPSNAYRFLHPVAEGNMLDGRVPELPARHDARCITFGWPPVERQRSITWPWSPDFLHDWWIDLSRNPDARPLGWHEDSSAWTG